MLVVCIFILGAHSVEKLLFYQALINNKKKKQPPAQKKMPPHTGVLCKELPFKNQDCKITQCRYAARAVKQ